MSPSTESMRLARLSAAMCRKLGVDRETISWRMAPEHVDAIHDLLDAAEGNPEAEALLDWLIGLAEQDLDRASGNAVPF